MLALAAVLAALVGVRVVVAAPVESVAMLRAVRCCAEHCGHAGGPARAARCCQVQEQASDPLVGLPGVGPSSGHDGSMVMTPRSVSTASAVTVSVTGHLLPIHRAGPLYLQTLSLRL